jgi:hypothetical protein
MNGGDGNDIFVFQAGFSGGLTTPDIINGFDANPNGGGQDRINVNAFGINADNFAARVQIVDLGANTQVTIDGTDRMVLNGVNGTGTNVITIADFDFNAPPAGALGGVAVVSMATTPNSSAVRPFSFSDGGDFFL